MKNKIFLKNLLVIAAIGILSSSCTVLAVGAIATAAGFGTAIITDPRNSGTVLNDNTIVAKLSSKLSSSKYPDSNIYVSCYNGVVLLTGQIKNINQINNIIFDAKSTPGVKQIYNYIETRLPQSFTSSTNDSYITTQIKTKLLKYDDIHSNNIKIITTNSVVYLLGVVTESEGNHIASISASTNGVNKVITIFEYEQL
jgi:osmotically-inducible protein OsmY